MPASLETVEAKVSAGARLDREDGLAVLASGDLVAVGRLADAARRRRHGLRAFYVVNTHVNYTNVCINCCRFCAFHRDPADPGAYLLGPEEVLARARPDLEAGATEVHIVGGLHPAVDLDYVLAVVARLHEAFPQVSVQAFTAVEVAYAAARAGLEAGQVLGRLRDAGLTGLPGGGAEIFDPEVRREICPRKISGRQWLDVHRAAHRLGIPTNATMLYGHVERAEHRVDHLLALRTLQDETGGFLAFVPLAFHPHATGYADRPGPTACDDLKTIACARLLLDNVPHVKAFWIMLGPDVAQVALRFGADDMDGTVMREEITHAAGARTPERLSAAEIEHLIRAAGCEPVERDTLYRRIVRRPPGAPAWTRREA
jgi:aminodeoxyfutalosine synthase